MSILNPVKLISEVKKRPGLYSADQPADREEKLALWKDICANIFLDWPNLNKAAEYDRVLQIQRKWRSLRDAYNRELRARRSGVRINRRVYIYFKKMSFLGGFEGNLSDENEADLQINDTILDAGAEDDADDPLISNVRPKKPRKKKKIKRTSSGSNPPPEEMELPVFPVEMAGENESDTDRLFLMSFLPEMRQLPINIKMWARAQIANVMQEAVACHYGNTRPPATSSEEKNGLGVKRQRQDSSE